jgi:phage terminase large subunit-like protein
MTGARETVLEERKSIAETVRGFERIGELRMAKTPEEQAADAADLIEFVAASGRLPEEHGIGFDPAQMDPLIRELQLRSIVEPLVVGIPQNWMLQPAHQGLALLLESKKVLHAGQEIMSWAAGNAKQELRGNNYMVTKQAAGVSKIDPLFATFNAYALMRKNPVAASSVKSYLETSSLVVV